MQDLPLCLDGDLPSMILTIQPDVIYTLFIVLFFLVFLVHCVKPEIFLYTHISFI